MQKYNNYVADYRRNIHNNLLDFFPEAMEASGEPTLDLVGESAIVSLLVYSCNK